MADHRQCLHSLVGSWLHSLSCPQEDALKEGMRHQGKADLVLGEGLGDVCGNGDILQLS